MSALDDDLQEAMQEFLESDGDGLLLLEVIRRAGQYRLPVPQEAHQAFSQALERYHSGECRELGEALKVKRPKGWNQHATTTRTKKNHLKESAAWRLFKRAEELHESGARMMKDGELWETVAGEFRVSPSRAYEIYYEVKSLMQ